MHSARFLASLRFFFPQTHQQFEASHKVEKRAPCLGFTLIIALSKAGSTIVSLLINPSKDLADSLSLPRRRIYTGIFSSFASETFFSPVFQSRRLPSQWPFFFKPFVLPCPYCNFPGLVHRPPRRLLNSPSEKFLTLAQTFHYFFLVAPTYRFFPPSSINNFWSPRSKPPS